MSLADARALDIGRAVLALLALLVPPAAAANDLLRIAVAAQIAATSVRVVRDAIRSGDLAAFGRQRDRCVRRSDLDAWIASRASKPVAGPDDRDLDRRILRLAGPR